MYENERSIKIYILCARVHIHKAHFGICMQNVVGSFTALLSLIGSIITQ